jgi:hypothetical protein
MMSCHLTTPTVITTCANQASLSPPLLFIEVPTPSQEKERSCVIGVSIFLRTDSTILQVNILSCSDTVVFLFHLFAILFPKLTKN